mmetsp:Transcript_18708/g.33827  ORF Transcript_18708/g.33827 Transcript_18708/m.33827 type:complete len:348 (+) Transcript_18708:49-1092(+)
MCMSGKGRGASITQVTSVKPPPGLEEFGPPPKLVVTGDGGVNYYDPHCHTKTECHILTEKPCAASAETLSLLLDDGDKPQLDIPMPVARSMVAEAQKTIKGHRQRAVPAVEVLQLWIRACDRLKNPSLAYALYKYTVEHYGMPGDGWSLDSNTCDSLLGAFCKGAQPELAVCFFEHMFELGVRPTTSGVCLAISAFVKTGAFERALCWFLVLRRSGAIPNMTAYNALISGCAKDVATLETALDFYKMLLEDGLVPTTITYNALIECVQRQDSAPEDPPSAVGTLVCKLVERNVDATAILQVAAKQVSQGSFPSAKKDLATKTNVGRRSRQVFHDDGSQMRLEQSARN